MFVALQLVSWPRRIQWRLSQLKIFNEPHFYNHGDDKKRRVLKAKLPEGSTGSCNLGRNPSDPHENDVQTPESVNSNPVNDGTSWYANHDGWYIAWADESISPFHGEGLRNGRRTDG